MPGRGLKAWLEAASITEGAIFRSIFNRRPSGSPIGALRPQCCQRRQGGRRQTGVRSVYIRRPQPALGLVTTAVKRGVNLMKVCDQTGHKSLEMLRCTRAMPSCSPAMLRPDCSEKNAYGHMQRSGRD